MKGKVFLAGIAGLASVVAMSSESVAGAFDSKLQAAVFNTKLVQAEDECVNGPTIIGGLDACAPANVTTDGTQFSVGKLLVKSKNGTSQVLAILKSSGNGETKKALAGKVVKVRLTLRVTRLAAGTAPAATWEDQTLNCQAVTVPASGNMVWKGPLAGIAGCNLDSDLAGDGTEKEIVSASIVTAVGGEAIAVPGVRKK